MRNDSHDFVNSQASVVLKTQTVGDSAYHASVVYKSYVENTGVFASNVFESTVNNSHLDNSTVMQSIIVESFCLDLEAHNAVINGRGQLGTYSGFIHGGVWRWPPIHEVIPVGDSSLSITECYKPGKVDINCSCVDIDKALGRAGTRWANWWAKKNNGQITPEIRRLFEDILRKVVREQEERRKV